MAKKPLSNRQYLNRSGMFCPICHKSTVESEGPQLTEDDALLIYQKIRCTSCHAAWGEVFTMTGIKWLYDGNGVPVYREGNGVPVYREGEGPNPDIPN